MVKSSIRPVLYKYAFACIEVFSDELKKETVHSLLEKIAALKKSDLLITTQLPSFFSSLFKLLVSHKRSELFFAILDILFLLWCERNNVSLFFIYTVLPLSLMQRENIEDYLRKNNEGMNINCIYKIDTRLIAGIRIESCNGVWDYSLKSRLEKVRKIVCDQGVL